MPIFDDAHFERRFFTRYLGGFTVFECIIVATVVGLAVLIFGYWPPPIPIIAAAFGVSVARWSRKIDTDNRPLPLWLADMALYCIRLRPLLARRQVYGKPFTLPGPQKTGGVVQLPRERRSFDGQSRPAIVSKPHKDRQKSTRWRQHG